MCLVSERKAVGPGLAVGQTPDNFRGPVDIFSSSFQLPANGNYWRKLSDMLHEVQVKIKI